MKLRVWAAACLIAICSANAASGESDNNTLRDADRMRAIRESRNEKLDEGLVKYLSELRGGAVIFDMHFKCGSQAAVQVARLAKDNTLVRTNIRTSTWVFGTQDTYLLRITMLPPGDYEVLGAICKSDKSTRLYNGPFAKFQVKLGELVNVGALKIDYKSNDILFGTSATVKKSIESLTPEALADLAQKYPSTFPKAVARRMEMMGPAEVTMKPQSPVTGKPCVLGTAIC
ncbi:MAG TPA: hypothetical protein VJL90_07995 [Pseudorhodoplanes sp.]|nr:hypothetical protein [Pseudorhodoplanes sp.]